MASIRTIWPRWIRPSVTASARARGTRCGRRVGVALDRIDDLLGRQLQAMRHAVHDPPDSPDAAQPVDLASAVMPVEVMAASTAAARLTTAAEDFASRSSCATPGGLRVADRAAVELELLVMLAVGEEMGAAAPRSAGALPAFVRLEDHCAGAVAEEDAVLGSFQSRMREKVSAPITSARLTCPALMTVVGGERRIRSRSRPPARPVRSRPSCRSGAAPWSRSRGRCDRASRSRE